MEQVQAMAMAERLERVKQTIAEAAERSGRSANDVTLVAVSKTFGADQVLEAIRLGIRHVGENRVQEAEEKIGDVARAINQAGLPSPAWHLIGHLQTNKARVAARLFSMIESVDSTRLATVLDRQGSEQGRSIDVLLEVNVGGEASKFGLTLADASDAFAEISQLPMIRVRGLMTVAPWVAEREEARPYFRALRALRDDLTRRFPKAELDQLSMGMTGDYPVAIEEGATIVRVGRAIFGERPVAI
jgi:pyridoxal phosphate enzyme (YggS family)